MEGTHKGVHKGRVEAADVDRCGPSSYFKEARYGRRDPQTVDHNELGSHVGAQISHLVSGSTANMVLRDPCSNETAERFGCSNYDIQEITGHSRFSSQYDDGHLKFKRKKPSNSNEARGSDQRFLDPARNSEPGNTQRIQCQNINYDTFPADRSFISSKGTYTEVPSTSFQFYVSSEEGVNLSVDLSSSPSDWIRSLKNKVCISSELQNSNSGALHYDLKGLGYSDGQMKSTLLGNTLLDFQTGGDPVSIKSSLGSIVGESLKPSTIIPTSTPIEISGQNGGQPDLKDLTHDLQTEGGGSENCALDQNTDKDPLSACPEEQCYLRKPPQLDLLNEPGLSSPMEGATSLMRLSSESQIETCWRGILKGHAVSNLKGFKVKTQHRCSEDQTCHTKPAPKNLRSGKTIRRKPFLGDPCD